MEETICSGWLTKSPPEKFVKILRRAPFAVTQKLIKAKWRRRYFVLYKPAGSLPGEYTLDYYTDDSRRHHKGAISLAECERIQSSLESSYYQHLFSLQTMQKGTPRLYYLAADSEADMVKWVHCLSNVCGLNPEPLASPTLEPAPSPTAPVPAIDVAEASATPPPPPVRIDSISGNEYSPAPVPTSAVKRGASMSTAPTSHDPESYIPLDECSTGVTNAHLGDRSPSPIRESYSSDRGSAATDSVSGKDLYDIPPTHDGARARSERESTGSESTYQVPPVRTPSHCTRPAKPQQQEQTQWHRMSDASSSWDSDVTDYDVLPLATSPSSGPRPARPPKPSSVMLRAGDGDSQAAHHDVGALPIYEHDEPVGRCDADGDDETYDFPRTVVTTVDARHLPASSPPPCDGGSIDVSVHKYINAGLAVMHAERATAATSDFPDVGEDEDADDLYSVPPAPVVVDDFRRQSSAPFGGGGGESMYNSPRLLTGGAPPPPQQSQPRRCMSLNPPAPQPGRPFKPRQLRDSHIGVSSVAEGTYDSPTRAPVTYSKQLSVPMGSSLADPIPLPTKTGTGVGASDSSNDDDDDADSDSSSCDAEGSAIYQAPRPGAATTQKPVAAATGQHTAPHPSGVEYLDIAHDTGAENHSPLPSRSASFGNQAGISSAGGSSATEYTDIDRVKTKALETTKKDLEATKKDLEATKKDLEARKGSEKE